MTTWRGKSLVIRRDGTVIYDGQEIGAVYPDPGDMRINHDWLYTHKSGTREDDIKGMRPGVRERYQSAFTKRDAGKWLADLHNLITRHSDPGVILRDAAMETVKAWEPLARLLDPEGEVEGGPFDDMAAAITQLREVLGKEES